MEVDAKITLSELEQQLILHPEWIHAKNSVMNKWISVFARLADQLRSYPGIDHFPEEVRRTTPKIAKGEQYKGLPYLMLDYPRYFEADHMFAIRTFFWWGHYFSSTLQLKGKYLQRISIPQLEKSLQKVSHVQWMINQTEEEWVHDYSEIEHWKKLDKISRITPQNKLLKIGVSLPIQNWETAEVFLKETFIHYVNALIPEAME